MDKDLTVELTRNRSFRSAGEPLPVARTTSTVGSCCCQVLGSQLHTARYEAHAGPKTCDFQINSKEVSRRTAQIYTEDEQVPLVRTPPPSPLLDPLPRPAMKLSVCASSGPLHTARHARNGLSHQSSLSLPIRAQAWLASVGHSPVTLNGVLVEGGHPALLQTGDTFEVQQLRSHNHQ